MAVFNLSKVYYLYLIAILGFSMSCTKVLAQGYGQNRLSGTIITEENKAFMATHKENIQFFDDSTSRGILELPIKFHIIRKDDASGGVNIAQLQASLEKLNEHFLPIYLRFVALPDYNYINSDYFYQFEKEKEEDLVKKGYLDKTINIYVVGGIKHEKNNYNAYTYLPTAKNNKDRIFISNKALTDGVSLTRQIGHYLSLYPTHGTSAEDRARSDEFADGSNCRTAGDEICDTPADPRLDGRLVDQRCEYIGNIQDGNSKFFRPLLNNFMSDNPRLSCVNSFTRQQYARMLYAALNIRNYLSFPKSNFSNKQRKAMEDSYGLSGQVTVLTNGYEVGCDLERNLYRLASKQLPGTNIKLKINNSRKCYIYVLEGNNQKDISVYYPLKGDKPFFDEKSPAIEVPTQGSPILVDDLSQDNNYIAILFSKKQLPITEVAKKINELKNDKLNILQKIYYVLGNDIVSMNDLTYEKGSVQVSGLTSERAIIPIFIQYGQN